MAGKDAKSKSDRKGEGANALEKLDNAEAASVLRKLLDCHRELRSEAEAIASGMLAEISPFSVADEVEDAVLQFDYDDLNGRAGRHSWGYVEPSEAAGELLEEALPNTFTSVPREPQSCNFGHRSCVTNRQCSRVAQSSGLTP
jgi:hypothetical protein